MSEPGENLRLALDIFLEQRPELRAELDTLNPLAAQAKRETMAQYRAERLHEAFEAEAEAQNLFAWELTLQLISQSPQEFETKRLEVHKEVAQMAGLEWAEYCQLHGLADRSG
ncbi:DNA repair protein [Pseudomonas sp. WS 5059]|uniref:DUF6388 family protein n=1 Tax=unclassified Pseudomonas TaxID=196821 RepID=UPI00147618E0|nr:MULTISPECIES: DUF6388 family protein [unclassified Pseudomonas]NMX60593.1 DNA repair protein [Pseudomonas sp. WS 5079]NMX66999.1 DNA repair protein [Pseudomonas sp. WS 5111]NMX85062.1 DNA repair protein [Pseudomonas sp. WS 5010]NMY01670.1 DNA repair protein [Pseudomonas sp. WS 5059]NMY25866.1 DNA repair protein [Pseudomonas sp. WS 5021]